MKSRISWIPVLLRPKREFRLLKVRLRSFRIRFLSLKKESVRRKRQRRRFRR